MTTELVNGKTKTIAELSVDTQILIKHLKKTAVGEVVTYTSLGDLIGADVQGKKRYLLQSARDHVLKDDKMVFECVEGEGLKRMSDTEIVELTAPNTMTKIRRAAKVGIRKLACADYDKLTPQEKTAHNSGLSMLGALHQFSKPASLQLLTPKVEELKEKLSFVKTLELFSK